MYDQSVYGALLIYPLKQDLHYDHEHVLMLSDWWHKPDTQQVEGLTTSNQFSWIEGPQSLLFNGKSIHNSSATNAEYHVSTVEPGTIVRFRVIGATSLSYLALVIQGHVMDIVEVDGTIINPVRTDRLEINAGQRYSVLVKITDTPGDYWMQTRIRYISFHVF